MEKEDLSEEKKFIKEMINLAYNKPHLIGLLEVTKQVIIDEKY